MRTRDATDCIDHKHHMYTSSNGHTHQGEISIDLMLLLLLLALWSYVGSNCMSCFDLVSTLLLDVMAEASSYSNSCGLLFLLLLCMEYMCWGFCWNCYSCFDLWCSLWIARHDPTIIVPWFDVVVVHPPLAFVLMMSLISLLF